MAVATVKPAANEIPTITTVFLGEVGGRLRTLGGRIHEVEEAITAAEALLARETEAVAECRRRQTLVDAEAERLAREIDQLVEEQAAAAQAVASQQALRERVRAEADGLSARLRYRCVTCGEMHEGLPDVGEGLLRPRLSRAADHGSAG